MRMTHALNLPEVVYLRCWSRQMTFMNVSWNMSSAVSWSCTMKMIYENILDSLRLSSKSKALLSPSTYNMANCSSVISSSFLIS